MKTEVAQDIRDIFNAPNLKASENLLKQAVEKYATRAKKLADWMEQAIPQGLTVYQYPRGHQRRLRTVNAMERINKEIRRRTRVATLFPHEAACLRLAAAVLLETHEEWATGKQYLNMELLTHHLEENSDLIYRKDVA